jgi:hypothetical protein
MIKKIISGGQTGADQAGLLAGKDLKIKTGGTAPRGWITDDGPYPKLKLLGLEEGPEDPRVYPKRTILNVQNSDGTVWFGRSTSPGGRLTLGTCRRMGKPYIENPTPAALRKWAIENGIEVLNLTSTCSLDTHSWYH